MFVWHTCMYTFNVECILMHRNAYIYIFTYTSHIPQVAEWQYMCWQNSNQHFATLAWQNFPKSDWEERPIGRMAELLLHPATQCLSARWQGQPHPCRTEHLWGRQVSISGKQRSPKKVQVALSEIAIANFSKWTSRSSGIILICGFGLWGYWKERP